MKSTAIMRIAFAIVTITLTTPALAGYFDGFYALDTGDYDKAYEEWRASATTGDAKSMSGLGMLYEEGLGVPKDDVMAAVYYDLASLLGSSEDGAKRDAVRRRLSQSEQNEALALGDQVKETGKLPPKLRVAGAGQSGTAAVEPTEDTQPETSTKEPPPDEQQGTQQQQGTSNQQSASASSQAPGVQLVELCKFALSWQDKGSNGQRDLAIYAPRTPKGVWFVGSFGQGNYSSPDGCTMGVKPMLADMVQRPRGWKLIWKDKGSGAQMDGSLWQAMPQSNDYVCLGSVAQEGYNPPKLPNYACVHRCMVSKRKIGKSLWDDRGTNADTPVSVHRLRQSGTIIAFAGRPTNDVVLDLDPTAGCVAGG